MFKIWSEWYEQNCLVNWLEYKKYKYSAIPMDTWTTVSQTRKNKMLWVRGWLPDLLIILKRWSLLFLEMKKCKWKRWWANGTKVSDKQKEWISALNKIHNVEAVVCYWYEEAKSTILDYESK